MAGHKAINIDGGPGVQDNVLGQMIKHHRQQRNTSVSALAADIGVDKGYLYRLEMQATDWLNRPLQGAPAKQPARDLVIRIAFALHLSIDECDELLLLAGYAPLFRPGSRYQTSSMRRTRPPKRT